MSQMMIYQVFAYGVMSWMLLSTVAHYWTAMVRARRWKKVDAQQLAVVIDSLADLPTHEWHRVLRRELPAHPSTQTLLWTSEKRWRYTRRDYQQQQLLKTVEKELSDLFAASKRNGQQAPTFGFIFTILGLMLFSLSAADNLSVDLMLQTLGPALGTTAFGGVISILEKRLCSGVLAQINQRYRSDGQLLLDSFYDQVLQRHWEQRMQPGKNTLLNEG